MTSSNKNFTINWISSHIGIPGNEEADTAAKDGTTKPAPDTVIPTSHRQTKKSFQQTAQHRWQDQIQTSQSTSVHWRFALPNTSEAKSALNNLPRRTQIRTRMRVKAKTARQINDHINTCAYCNQDIQCQHVHDLTECPRTSTLRKQLIDQLKPEQHVSNNEQLAINILKTQTFRQYQELQHYTFFKPQC